MQSTPSPRPEPSAEASVRFAYASRFPKWVTGAVIAICVLPALLTMMGWDWGSRTETFIPSDLVDADPSRITEATFNALQGAFHHTFLELAAFGVALLTALLSFVHYGLKRDPATPIVAVALFCAGAMDLFHIVAADRLVHAVADNEQFVPFTWALSRMFSALILVAGAGLFLTPAVRDRRLDLRFVLVVCAIFGLAALASIRLAAITSDLPTTMFPDSPITRPWDVVPLILFVVAAVGVLPAFHRRHPSVFSHALIIGAIPEIATEAYMAFGSVALYDHYFNVAHGLKVLAYVVPLTGLLADYVSTHQREMTTTHELQRTKQRLEGINRELSYQTTILDSTLDTVAEGIIVADPQGRFLVTNRAAREMVGVDFIEDDPANWSAYYGLFDPATGEPVDPADLPLARAIAGDAVQSDLLVRNPQTPQGRYLRVNARPLRDDTDMLRGGVASFSDITQVTNAVAALELQARELSRSNAELEQFAFIASHDLREPARKVTAFAGMLRQRAADAMDERSREFLDRIESATARMQQLIDDLLLYSRVSTHAKTQELVDLEVIASEVAEDLEHQFRETGGALEIGTLPTVPADPTQVRQLFQNLVANSLKYRRPDTAPVIRIASAPLSPASEGAHHHRITVEDNGIGFEQEYAERIFRVFQRLHGRDEYEGTGIGLAICRKIAERHGWTIAATGEAGVGATFEILIHAGLPDEPANATPSRFRRMSQPEGADVP